MTVSDPLSQEREMPDIEELREDAAILRSEGYLGAAERIGRAIDELSRLRAEIKELREAMESSLRGEK